MTRRRVLAALLACVLLAIVHTWPLASAPGTLSRNDTADTMLNEWTLAWVAHQLPRDPRRLLDANIFHPERRTLLFSEHMIVQALMGLPLFAAGASPVLVYNLVMLAGFALTAWAMFLVVYRWTGDTIAALVAGSLAAFNAHAFSRMPHLQALHVEFLPVAMFALDRLLVTRRYRWAIVLAAAFSLQSLTSIYWMAFASFAVLAGFLVRPEDWLGRKLPFRPLAVAALVAACVLLPVLLAYYQVSREHAIVRPLTAMISATWRDYLSTPARLHFGLWSGPIWLGGATTPLFPGVLAFLLAAFAAVTLARANRAVRMWAAIAFVAVLVSFGSSLPGYGLLYELFPLLKGIRAPVRAGHLFLVAVAALAGFGLAHARARWAMVRHPAVTVAVALVVTAEVFVAPLGLMHTEAPPAIYDTLAGERDAVVVELPFPRPTSRFRNARFMLASTRHWRPMLNGYSGLMPASYVRHWEHLRSFPSPESLAYLVEQGVTHAIVHSRDRQPVSHPALEPIASDGAITVFRLRPERIERLDR